MVKISKSNMEGGKLLPILDSRFANVYNNGHIPSSLNVPFTEVLNPDKTYKSREELIEIIKKTGI
jgi:3-mercaptopyruvate sulfurtransferase SseA